MSIEKRPRPSALSRRKKIWDVDGYQCSILGTCFNAQETRKIARRKVLGMSSGLSDYLIHNTLVNLATTMSPGARLLHKLLDRKFEKTVKKFDGAISEKEVRELWQEALAKGSVAGAYWAVHTHPATSKELASAVHGDVHMLSHELIGAYQRRMVDQHKLKTRCSSLEERIAAERAKAREFRKAFETLSAEKAALEQQCRQLQKENRSLQDALEEKEGSRPESQGLPAVTAYRDGRLLEENTMLHGRVDHLENRLEEELRLRRFFEKFCRDLERVNQQLSSENQALQDELMTVEKSLIGSILASSHDCENCDELGTPRCPGPSLCGKTVLYVGGLQKMIPHYRQLVEKYGGTFMHHDGGREVSRAVLPKMLSSADAVLCPVDCVSHDACLSVKKICKRYQKPYVMMRSSGLSSLARGLTEIAVRH